MSNEQDSKSKNVQVPEKNVGLSLSPDADESPSKSRPIITIEEADEDLPLDFTSVTNTNVKNGLQTKVEEDTVVTNDEVSRGPRFGIHLNWRLSYFKTSVGLLRLLFMLCVTLSLVCLGNAGTDDIDVLELPAFSQIRFHIFTCVLVLLVGAAIYTLEITSLINSMPANWYLVEIFSSFILGVLCIVSSTLVLHAGNAQFDDNDDDNSDGNSTDEDDDTPAWSSALLALTAVFGYFATLVSVFLIVFKCFNRRATSAPAKCPTHVQEEILMTSSARS